MNINVIVWNKFCLENFDKFRNIQRYPLDRDKVGEWILSHEEGILRDTARIMSNLFQNVSFEDFLLRLDRIANEIVLFSSKEKLSLYIPSFGFRKSFMFVAILLTYILYHKGVYFSKVVINDFYYTEYKDEIIIFCDDANYSCNQIEHILNRIKCKKIFLAIPYHSKICSNIIEQEYKNTNYSVESVEFLSFKDYIKKLVINEFEKIEILNVISYNDFAKKHALYFDFKMPDGISICNRIFEHGDKLQSDFHNLTGTNNFSLIENCKNISDDKYDQCPLTIYKFIDYTYNGKSIDRLTDLQ